MKYAITITTNAMMLNASNLKNTPVMTVMIENIAQMIAKKQNAVAKISFFFIIKTPFVYNFLIKGSVFIANRKYQKERASVKPAQSSEYSISAS